MVGHLASMSGADRTGLNCRCTDDLSDTHLICMSNSLVTIQLAWEQLPHLVEASPIIMELIKTLFWTAR